MQQTILSVVNATSMSEPVMESQDPFLRVSAS